MARFELGTTIRARAAEWFYVSGYRHPFHVGQQAQLSYKHGSAAFDYFFAGIISPAGHPNIGFVIL